ncbi:pancreatic lipase-related protein 2-like isoform X2 [Haemaphysalis longicornis]
MMCVRSGSWVTIVVASLVTAVTAQNGNGDSTDAPPSGNSLTRCYGKYGCFSVGEPFLSIQRPLNLFPLPAEALNVQFFLRTRRNNEYYQRLKAGDADSFADSKFDSTRPTMFIIHGYLEHGYLKWVLDMSTELLTKDNYNVIVVDWGQAAQPPYTQAVANARMVGALVADMIMHIQDKYSVAGSDFHLIGYNVGAHIAGYAGERVKGIGRITGLDPADPYFANTDKVVRLDPTDADFVDVIHTGGSTFDASPNRPTVQDYGHLDFYPNGGAPLECQEPGIRRYVSCNDQRSQQYFTESVNSDCPFYGFACDSYANFTAGACGAGCGADGMQCAPMGYRAVDWRRFADESRSVRMFLTAATTTPYCRNQYHVQIGVSSTEETRKQHGNRGSLYVHLQGSRPEASLANVIIRKYDDFSSGKKSEFLVVAGDLGRIVRLDLEWRPDQVFYPDQNQVYAQQPQQPGAAPQGFDLPRLWIDYIQVRNLATGEKFVFCGEGTFLQPNVAKTLFAGGACEFEVGGATP